MLRSAILAAVLVGVVLSAVDYTGFKVIEFQIENEEQLNFLNRFINVPRFIFDEHLMTVGRPTTIGVPPEYVTYITKQAHQLNLPTQVIYHDLQTIIDLEKQASAEKSNLDNFNFDEFNTFDDIVAQIDVWVETCPAGLVCEKYSYGESFEGRTLWALRIGVEGGNENAYWMHGVTHCREWLGTATLLKVMDRFWTGYGSDPVVNDLINSYDWYFSPVHNPDGYEYTWTDDRMWRKNRGDNEGSICRGTDLNRNYDIKWGTEGVSHNPCDTEVYCGDFAASEPETVAIQNEIARIASQQNLLGFIDMHTFGQMILMPLSTSVDGDGRVCEEGPNHADQTTVTEAFADAIENTFGTRWDRGSPCEILYTVSGGSMDWAIIYGGARYGFATELRGPWFSVNPDQIQPSYEEYFNGVVAMVETIREIEGV